MKLYGAGSIEEIEKCSNLGVSGILTNPQGFDQYFQGKMTLEEITRSIIEVTDLPIFIQIHGESTEALIHRARTLHEISPKQLGFKIISDEKGFRAIRQLQQEEIQCIATTLFTISQAAVAATVDAFGICPFVSRARVIGMDPRRIIKTIKDGYQKLKNPPEIIAVSLKDVSDVELALSAGADGVAMRYPLLRDMMSHPLSQKAEVLFGNNWQNVKGEDVSYLKQSMNLKEAAE